MPEICPYKTIEYLNLDVPYESKQNLPLIEADWYRYFDDKYRTVLENAPYTVLKQFNLKKYNPEHCRFIRDVATLNRRYISFFDHQILDIKCMLEYNDITNVYKKIKSDDNLKNKAEEIILDMIEPKIFLDRINEETKDIFSVPMWSNIDSLQKYKAVIDLPFGIYEASKIICENDFEDLFLDSDLPI